MEKFPSLPTLPVARSVGVECTQTSTVPPGRKPVPLAVLVDPARRSSDPEDVKDGPFAKLSAKLKPVSPTVIPSSIRVTGVGTTVPPGIVIRPAPTGASSIASVVVVLGAVVVVVCTTVDDVDDVDDVGAVVEVDCATDVEVDVDAVVVDVVEEDVDDDVLVGAGAEVVTELFALSRESSASVPLPSAWRLTW